MLKYKQQQQLELERQVTLLEQELLRVLLEFEAKTGRAVRDITIRRRTEMLDGTYLHQPYSWDNSEPGRVGEPALRNVEVKLEQLPLMSGEAIQEVLSARRAAQQQQQAGRTKAGYEEPAFESGEVDSLVIAASPKVKETD